MDCPICLEGISNIHALMCGHSYCGPPKPCLNTLEHDEGKATKCAICNTVLPFRVSDLKPLYGIREALNDIQNNSKNKETARKILPLLDDIDSVLSETDREIEMLTDKKLKLEQLKEHKTSIAQFVDGQISSSNGLKELLESEWIQNFDRELKKSLKPFKFTATITNVKDIQYKTLLSDKYHFGGFLFHVRMKCSTLSNGDEWAEAIVLFDSVKSRASNLEAEFQFQIVLLSSEPAETVKFHSSLFKSKNWNMSTNRLVLTKSLFDPSNGFISNDGSVTFEIYFEHLRIL